VEGRRLLLHRLYADGQVHLDAPEAVALPRSAVIQTGPQAVVYVDEGSGTFARRVVQLGRRGDEFVEVLKGVEAGDKVVINSNLLIDGQAEMNRAFSDTAHEDRAAMADSADLNDQERIAITALVGVNDSLALALAKDDLAAFNHASKTVMAETEKLVEILKGRAELKDILTHLAEARHIHVASDIGDARKRFHPYANAAAKTLEILQNAKGMPGFQVFECPMVDQAIPGVPRRGRWVQNEGRGIGNPFFGAEMLECGKRVIPEGPL
jgi:membrane fusion protein, copper/silver efflux system